MKIYLIISPSKQRSKVPERVYGCTFSYYRQLELPLLYVAAVLEDEGHKVTYQDFTLRNSWKEFCQFVKTEDCDVYIFHTVLLSESVDLKAARFIADNTNSKIIFFGPHPTLKPENFLFNKKCYVARGEAEYVIRDLVKSLKLKEFTGTRGVSYLKNGEVIDAETFGIIEDIDSLPLPAIHLVDNEKKEYANPKMKESPVALALTSRGCSFRCSYCVPNSISWARELEWRRFHSGEKPPVTQRSSDGIIKEFKNLKAHGYKAVSIVDDMFLFGGKKRIMDICRGLEDVGLPFGLLARCDFIFDDEIIGALARAGAEYVDLGIESLDQDVLNDINKNLDISKVKEAIELLRKYKIEPKANIMFGASSVETKASIESTIRQISKYPINYCMFSIATPFPGTEFFKKALKEGWISTSEINDLENRLSPMKKSLVSYSHLKKKDIERAVKKANRSFYMNPGRIWFQLKKVKSFKRLKDLIVTGWKVVK